MSHSPLYCDVLIPHLTPYHVNYVTVLDGEDIESTTIYIAFNGYNSFKDVGVISHTMRLKIVNISSVSKGKREICHVCSETWIYQ